MTEETQATPTENGQAVEPVLQIQRIYVKDISFEAPNLPEIFQKEWNPQLNVELSTENRQLGEGVFEVSLNLSVETKLEESQETAFLCEIKQAGIFTIVGMEDFQLAHCLGSQCPNILFPYARELVANLVNRGTFPALNLSPVNFDQLFIEAFERHQSAQQEEQAKVN